MRIRIISIITITCLINCLMTIPSFAYFNRGTVYLELGQSQVSLNQGKSISLSVTIDPIQEQQLPGCGMAECPQSCGNSGCLNENGECTCGGTIYKTYYSSVTASSGNSSVATASYSNGSLKITGVGPGKTTVSVIGQMRQYTDCTKKIIVTVSGDSSQGGSISQAHSKSADQGQNAMKPQDNKDEVKVTEVGEKDKAIVDEKNEESAEQDNKGSDVIQTKRGKFEMVKIDESTDTKSFLENAISDGHYVTFQKKTRDNVDYSWTFNGKKMTSAETIDLGVKVGNTYPEKLSKKLKGINVVYMGFDYKGRLPGSAEIYINVSDTFPKDCTLYLYHYDASSDKLEQISDQIKVENGYATFTIDHCSDYFLSDSAIHAGALNKSLIAVSAGMALFCVISLAVMIRKRKRIES